MATVQDELKKGDAGQAAASRLSSPTNTFPGNRLQGSSGSSGAPLPSAARGAAATALAQPPAGLSYADNNASVGQDIRNSWNAGNYGQAAGKTVAGSVGMITTPLIDGAVGAAGQLAGFGRGLFGMSEPNAQPVNPSAPAAAAPAAAAPVAPAASPAAAMSAPVSPATAASPAPAAMAPGSTAVQPGVFQHGRGQYSDRADGMGLPTSFTGQPNEKNLAAADRLAATAAVPGAGAGTSVGSAAASGRYSAPTVAHSGNDWQARQNLKNMATAANSITNTRQWGGPGAENNPNMLAYRDAHRADMAAQGKQVDAELATQGYNAGIDRERLGQDGANTRAGMQERGAAARAMGQLNLGQQRLGLDSQRAAGENALRATQVRAADRMANIQDQYLGAKTDEERMRLASQIRAMNGQGSEEAWAHSPGGQVVDPKTNMLVTQPGVIYNRRTGQAMGQQSQLPPPDQHAEAIAVRDDPKLSREEKADRLSKMGYQR